jgi:NAD(P)-dependent dehydrogenase (short-subunit alcohol dehydrogenase family)
LALRYGVRHLLLVSRRGMANPDASVVIAELAELGAHAVVAACDVTDRAALEALLAEIPSEHPLAAVIHAAAVLEYALIENIDNDKLSRVLRSKLDAALHLDALTAHMDLSAFVLFSSAAGLLGNAGQAAYAAANVFLDALASRRRASGKHALSLAWGPWDGVGMTVTLSDIEWARLRRAGIVPMSVADGLALFDAALRGPDTLLVPMKFDPAALARDEASVPPLLRRLVPSRGRATVRRAAQTSTMVLAHVPRHSVLPTS